MHARTNHRSCDAGGKIAIADKPNTRSRASNIGNQLFMARTVEHDHHQVFHVAI